MTAVPAPRRKNRMLWAKLDEYLLMLERSPLADKSVEDYYLFAEFFVRWIDGTFIPGERAYGSRDGILQIEAQLPPPPRQRKARA